MGGLMGSGAEEKVDDKPPPKKKTQKPKNLQQETSIFFKSSFTDQPNSVAKVETSPPLKGTVAVTDYTVAADLQDLNDKIKSMMEVSEHIVGGSQGNIRKRICKVCGKEGQWAAIRNHIEVHHITGVSHTCNICGTTTRSRHAMMQHKRN